MPSPAVSVGKRPEFRQSKSAAWSWPRLVPINEQYSRVSQASQPSVSPSLRNHNEQEELPPTMIASIVSKMYAEEDAPLSPVPSPADRSHTAEESSVGEPGHQPYEHMPGSLLSTADLDDGEERAARSRDASSISSSIEDPARNNYPGTKRGSVQDATEESIPVSNVEFVQDVVETSPRMRAGSIQDAAEKNSPALDRGPVQDADKTSADINYGSLQVAAEKNIPASIVEPVEDVDATSPRTKRGSIQDAAENSPGSGHETVRNLARKSSQSSNSGPAEDTAETSASASDHGLIENTANQEDTEIPVAYESAIVPDDPLKEDKPATPIPSLMDRVSIPSTSVPYYATPKIMVHRPSQSSEENPASRTIDEVLASERQSMPQETNFQSSQNPLDASLSQTTPDASLMNESPMQIMSLKPIAWQAPKDQKVQKRKLYIRKIRNAAARKTILKATLGRQLAVPTKQMLRLLANGENLIIPDVSKSDVEAATMLVQQDAVGSVTGAVLLPQGVGGPVPEN